MQLRKVALWPAEWPLQEQQHGTQQLSAQGSTACLDCLSLTGVLDAQGLGYADSTPTPKLQDTLQLKAGIVTSGGISAAPGSLLS